MSPRITEPAIAGDVNTARVTNDRSPTFQANVSDPDGDPVSACFKIVGQAASPCDTNTASGGDAEVTWPSDLADGNYQVYAVATSGAGVLTSTSTRRRVVVDRTAPSVPIVTYPEGPWQMGVARNVSVSAMGGVLSFRYTMNGNVPTCVFGTSVTAAGEAATLSVTPSEAGNNKLQVVACDRVGNPSEVHISPTNSTGINTPGARAAHAWDWDGFAALPLGVDSGVAGSLMDLTDYPVPTRGARVDGPKDFNDDDDKWLSLGAGQERAFGTGSSLAGLTQGFTVSGWVKVSPGIASEQVIVSQAGASTDTMRLSATSTGWRFAVSNGAGGAMSAVALAYESNCGPGMWCYVTGVWNPTTGIRVASVPKADDPAVKVSLVTTAPNPPALTGTMLRVGQGQSGGTAAAPVLFGPLIGGVDRLRIYDAARGDEDIRKDSL